MNNNATENNNTATENMKLFYSDLIPYSTTQLSSLYSSQKLTTAFLDIIDSAPFLASDISQTIQYFMEQNKEIKDAIFMHVNNHENVSRQIYNASLFDGKKVENSDLICCVAILSELAFDKELCIKRLRRYTNNTVIDAIINEESIFNISLVIRLCEYPDFLDSLIPRLKEFKWKDKILAFILLNSRLYEGREKELLNEGREEDMDFCKKVVDDRALDRVFGIRKSKKVVDEMSLEEFEKMNFKSKNEFFDGFLRLTFPSVSHFLSYLEKFKGEFRLTSEEKDEFVRRLRKIHEGDDGYVEIVESKMRKFGIL